MQRDDLAGKRYRNLIRCSTDGQEGTSDRDQLLINTTFANHHGMAHIGDMLSIGVSGSETFNRDDIEELKKQAGTFDVLLVHDLSRLTRGGIDHAARLHSEFLKVGVEVVSVMDSIPPGPEGDLIRAVINYQNSLLPRTISFGVVRGFMGAMKSANMLRMGPTPIGCDRMYIADGKDIERLRYEQDARYVLDPSGENVRERVPRGSNGKLPRFKKNASRSGFYVPGRAERAQLVNWIFERHFLHGEGFARIAQQLNTRSDAPPPPGWGTHWHLPTVHTIVRNPTYLGWRYIGMTANGKFFMMSNSSVLPVRTNFNQAMLEGTGRKTMPSQRKPECEWFHLNEPRMEDFIQNPVVRERAKAATIAYLKGYASRSGSKGLELPIPRDKHHQSTYFLKNIMFAGSESRPMAGQRFGRGKKRGYTVRNRFELYEPFDSMRRAIPAEPIEQVVIDILRHIVSQRLEEVRAKISQYLKQEQKRSGSETERRAKLVAQRDRKQRKLDALLSMKDELELEPWQQAIRTTRGDILRVIAEIESIGTTPLLDSDVLTKRAVLHALDVRLPVPADQALELRRLVETFVQRIEVNMETRGALVVVRLPIQVPDSNVGGVVSPEGSHRRYDPTRKISPEIGRFWCDLPLNVIGTQPARRIFDHLNPRYSWKQVA